MKISSRVFFVCFLSPREDMLVQAHTHTDFDNKTIVYAHAAAISDLMSLAKLNISKTSAVAKAALLPCCCPWNQKQSSTQMQEETRNHRHF